jgi:hypothetical protein
MAGDQRLEDDLEDIGVHAAGAIIAHLVSGHPGITGIAIRRPYRRTWAIFANTLKSVGSSGDDGGAPWTNPRTRRKKTRTRMVIPT